MQRILEYLKVPIIKSTTFQKLVYLMDFNENKSRVSVKTPGRII